MRHEAIKDTSIWPSFSASSGPKGPGVVGTWCETLLPIHACTTQALA